MYKGSMEQFHIGVNAHKWLTVIPWSLFHFAEANVTKKQSYNIIQPYFPSTVSLLLTKLQWNRKVSTLYHHCSISSWGCDFWERWSFLQHNSWSNSRRRSQCLLWWNSKEQQRSYNSGSFSWFLQRGSWRVWHHQLWYIKQRQISTIATKPSLDLKGLLDCTPVAKNAEAVTGSCLD